MLLLQLPFRAMVKRGNYITRDLVSQNGQTSSMAVQGWYAYTMVQLVCRLLAAAFFINASSQISVCFEEPLSCHLLDKVLGMCSVAKATTHTWQRSI